MMSAVFVDLDKTITSLATERAFALFLLKKGKLGFIQVLCVLLTYMQYELHIIKNYSECKRKLVKSILQGRDVDEMTELLDLFFAERLEDSLYEEIVEDIRRHKRENRRIVIVSAAIDLIVGKVSSYLGADDHYSTRLVVDDRRYTGETDGAIHYGAIKADAVTEYCRRHRMSPSSCYAYGDHGKDRYMLRSVGNAIAVNPDRVLREVAQEENWIIKDIKKGRVSS